MAGSGPGRYRDAEIYRDEQSVEISSAAAENVTICAAAVGKTPIVTRAFLTFQGTDQITFEDSNGTNKTGPMQFKVDGILDLSDARIIGTMGYGLRIVKAQAVAVRGYCNFIYR